MEEEEEEVIEIKLPTESPADVEEEKVQVSICSQTSNLGFKLVKKSKQTVILAL